MKAGVSNAVAFLKEIGAKNLHDAAQAKAELCRRLSPGEAMEVHAFWASICPVADISPEEHERHESFFNASYDRSIWTTLTLDYDLHRTAFTAFEKNSALFGGRILEYGCRNGILSCFLGRVSPRSKILSIDDCDCGLAHADRFRKCHCIENVTFRKGSLKTIREGEKFDTVVLTQTFQRSGLVPMIPSSYVTIEEEAEKIRDMIASYVTLATEHVVDGGCLVFVDYAHRGPSMLALIEALAERGFRWLDRQSVNGPPISYRAHRASFYAPNALFFEKTGETPDRQAMLKKFVASIEAEESDELPGYYFNETAHALLLKNAGEIIAGFAATFEYEDDRPDFVAGAVFRDKEDPMVFWREMQTVNEVLLCKYTDQSAQWMVDDIWTDAPTAIADNPDSFLVLSGTYDNVQREEISDYSKIPQPSGAPYNKGALGSNAEGLMDMLSMVPKGVAKNPLDALEAATHPKDAINDLIRNLASKSGERVGQSRLRIAKNASDRRKRKSRGKDAEGTTQLDHVHERGLVQEEDVVSNGSQSVQSTVKTNTEGLKITYFAKSGRLNVEDQTSGSQWCVTGKGVAMDGMKIDSGMPVRVGGAELSVEATNREIRLHDLACGCRFTIKLS